jgi:Cu-Zn family superoxide dismutase
MKKAFAPVVAAFLAVACASYQPGPSATAQLQPTKGNAVAGQVQFTQKGDKVIAGL